MRFKLQLIALWVISSLCYLPVFSQERPSRDESARKQAARTRPDTATRPKPSDQLQVKKGIYPAAVRSDGYGDLKVDVKSSGGAEIKDWIKYKITFGIVQVRTNPLKFIKCIRLKWENKCWSWETGTSASTYVNKSGTNNWFQASGYITVSDNNYALQSIADELNYNWGYYLNDLPEADKKDMRLGVKIELEDGTKNLVTTVPEGFLSLKSNYFPAAIEANKYGVLRVLIKNESPKVIVPKGTSVKAKFYPVIGDYSKFITESCLGYGKYGNIYSMGTCEIEGTTNTTSPINPGESRWVIINFAWMGDDFKRFKRIIDDFPVLYKNAPSKPKGLGVLVTVDGANKILIALPNPGFWVQQ